VKVVLACPTLTRPFDAFLEAVEAEVPHLDAAGFEHKMTFEQGSVYISWARASLLRKAMDWQPDVVVFLDHDMSWTPGHLTRLLQTEGDVIAGTYRYKTEPEDYMGVWYTDEAGVPITREDGCIQAKWVPAGFLKVTSQAVHDFMGAYPELAFGPRFRPYVDLFNHGAWEGVWYGEDYAFSRRWTDIGRKLWIRPDLALTHHAADGKAYPGDFHTYLRRLPGGDLAEAA
jgi:glycosyltransferase involved in cell wall biosynthesis